MSPRALPVGIIMLGSLLLAAGAAGQGSDSRPSRGSRDAKVTIEQFCDFQCGYCAEMSGTLRELQARYPQDVRLVYRHFPLDSHREAKGAAEAAACAGQQGRFWEMHDRLYSAQGDFSEQRYRRDAASLGLDVPRFMHCFNSGRGEAAWKSDLAEGRSRGASATPTLFVNGVMVEGARPVEELAQLVEQRR